MGKGKALFVYTGNYQSLEMIATYMQYIILIATAIITLRCLYMIIHMCFSAEENISFSTVFAKLQNNVKALVILMVVDAVIALLKKYLF